MPTPAGPRLDLLLAHREWVRVLSRSLTDHAADADDVEQQTWLAALTAARADVRSVRAWLATVAANAARKVRRSDARQRARAERRPAPAPVRSAAELAEEADTHGRVVAAVVALDEPYRQAVLLRYFEGIGVRDVAARTGVPLETARSRLQRARALLRERLAADLGPDRSRRLAVLAGTGLGPDGPPASDGPAAPSAAADLVSVPFPGVALMGAKTVVVAGAVLVAGALLVRARWSRPEPETAAAPPVATAPAEPPSSPRGRVHARAEPAPPAPAPARPDVAAESPAPAPVAATSARERLRRRLEEVDPLLETLVLDQTTGLAVFGRVADATDCPIVLTRRAEAALAASPLPSPLTFSARIDGERLLLTLPPLAGLTHVVEEDRVVVCAPGEVLGPSVEVVVAARPARPEPALVRGTVRDASGRLLGGAEIRHHDGVERVVATSAADGTWSFARRGLGAGSLQFLVARAPGHAGSAATRLTAPIPDEPIDLTLGGPAGAVRVRVTGDAGAVEGARVAIGPAEPRASVGPDGRPTWDLPRSATTGADGTCTIDGVAPGPVSVRAAKQGLQPATGSGVVAAGTTAEIDVRVGARPSLAARLAEVRVSVRFSDARVADVVSFLSRASGVNLLVAPDLAAQTVAPVSLTLTDEPLASALRTLCDQIPGAEIDVREAEGLVLLRSRPQTR